MVYGGGKSRKSNNEDGINMDWEDIYEEYRTGTSSTLKLILAT